MTLLEVRVGKFKIPAYESGAFGAGFYAGYMNSKGVPATELVEYLATPTILAMAATPFVKKSNQKMEKTLEKLTGENPHPERPNDYAKGAIKNGGTTAIATGIGYFTGTMYAHFN